MHFADSHFMLGVLHLFEIALAGLAREGVKDFNIQQWRYSSQSQYGPGKLNDNCLVDYFREGFPRHFISVQLLQASRSVHDTTRGLGKILRSEGARLCQV